jgi:hypothetical protein
MPTWVQKALRFLTNPPATSPARDWTLGGLSVSLEPEWVLVSETSDSKTFRTAEGDELSLRKSGRPADFPELTSDAVRAYGRLLAAANSAGLLSAEVVAVRHATCVCVIHKRLEMPAYAYIGVLRLPTAADLYTIALSTRERGTTGIRDAVATMTLLQRGEVKIPHRAGATRGKGVPLEGWLADPYDPDYTGLITRSRADDEEFDAVLPDHPLSVLRRRIRDLCSTMRLE